MGGVFKGHSVHFMLFLTISEAWFKDVGYTKPIQRETLIGEVMTMLHFDWAVLDWIQAHLASGFGDMVMPLITRLGDGGFLVWRTAAPPQNSPGWSRRGGGAGN